MTYRVGEGGIRGVADGVWRSPEASIIAFSKCVLPDEGSLDMHGRVLGVAEGIIGDPGTSINPKEKQPNSR